MRGTNSSALKKASALFITIVLGVCVITNGDKIINLALLSASVQSGSGKNYYNTKKDEENKNIMAMIRQDNSEITYGYEDGSNSLSFPQIPDSNIVKAQPTPVLEENQGPIDEKTMPKVGSNAGNAWVQNTTSKEINVGEFLNRELKLDLKKDKKPRVLIYHTHTTESYNPTDEGWFDKTASSRTTDESKNVCAVGDKIAATLEANGIGVVHDKTIHDSPKYSGAYSRSEQTIKKNLENNPSIQIILDIHRDAIGGGDTAKTKPTVLINGKKAAQIMIIVGSEDEKSLPNPKWEENLSFATKLQNQAETDYPGLTRSTKFLVTRYNQHLSTGALLLEVGSDGNTLEEATYSGELIGGSLAKLFK